MQSVHNRLQSTHDHEPAMSITNPAPATDKPTKYKLIKYHALNVVNLHQAMNNLQPCHHRAASDQGINSAFNQSQQQFCSNLTCIKPCKAKSCNNNPDHEPNPATVELHLVTHKPAKYGHCNKPTYQPYLHSSNNKSEHEQTTSHLTITCNTYITGQQKPLQCKNINPTPILKSTSKGMTTINKPSTFHINSPQTQHN